MAAQDWRILLKVDFERRILRGLAVAAGVAGGVVCVCS
jgi:hypothetical protein